MATMPWKKLLHPTRVSSLFPITHTFRANSNSVVPACSIRTDDDVKTMFEAWLIKYGVSYDTVSEKQMRFGVFKDILRFVDLHNSSGDPSWTAGLNHFSDRTAEEWSLQGGAGCIIRGGEE